MSHALRVVLPIFILGLVLVAGSSVPETLSRNSGNLELSGVLTVVVTGLLGGVAVVACYWMLASRLVMKKWFDTDAHDERQSQEGATSG